MKKLLSALLCASITTAFAQNDTALGINLLGHLDYQAVLNDVWGYADGNGNEYALVGATDGFSIVDVTDPTNPVEEHFIPGVNSDWRDIKTWGHYAYVIHHHTSFGGGSDGILIVDMNSAEATTPVFSNYYPSVTVGGNTETYSKSHNIYIDEKGVLYVFDANIGAGGALMFDLAADPVNPPFLGAVNSVSYHDGVARGDTLWGAAITTGVFQVVDVSDKSDPVLLGTQTTPHNFTHNIWFTDDNKTVFTTDEKQGAYIVAYDVSDMDNITELDRIRTGIYDPQQVIPHNVHVKGDFLVTSYYTSGLQIVDASRPDILVETAYYDTSPLEGGGYNGAWGAYPYLPSGNILVSDLQEGLFVLQSDYPRATYIEIMVKDFATGASLVNAQVDVLNSDISGASNIYGTFKDGQRDTGNFQMVVSKPGYHTDTVTVNLQEGVLLSDTVSLVPIGFSVGENAYGGEVAVFPNPSAGNIIIELPEPEGANVEVVISKLDGREVFRQKMERKKRISLQTQLRPGVYLINIMGAKEYRPKRVVVRP